MPGPRFRLSFNDGIGHQQRRENGSDDNPIHLPGRAEIQGQPADDLRLQQQETRSHAEEEKRRNALARFRNLQIKSRSQQENKNSHRNENARHPAPLLIEIGPVVGGDRHGRRVEKIGPILGHELTQRGIGGQLLVHLSGRGNTKHVAPAV